MLSFYLLSAFIMFLLEYFVILKIYQRSKTLEIVSLIVAPLIIILGILITKQLDKSLSPLKLFIVFALLELPFSLYGYQITPNANILERVIVVGSFGVVSVITAKALLSYF
jgi:hypothetical protein